MKQYCKICRHRCHCLGKGYCVSDTKCESCECNNCTHIETPLILNKPIKSKKFEMYTICILIILILGIGLVGCTPQEKNTNKMDTIAKGLSKIVK